MSQKWTRDPPCEAELLLENLFSSKKINDEDLPIKIYKEYPIFKGYSLNVFRNNFRRLREKNGMRLSKKY